MNKTWKSIREEMLMSSNNMYTILQGVPVKTNYYSPLESPFNSFDGVTPEEQEIVMDEEMRLLLCGFQTENIRIQFDAEAKLPRSLTPNPSLDPYMRSAIDRFFDVVHDLFIIRVYGHDIRANILRSRIARVVTFKIHEKLDVIMAPILTDVHNLNSDEGFHDSDYALNTLTRKMTAIRSTIRCYSEIILSIYQNNLTGGEVIDLLEEKLQQAVRDRQELQLLLKEAWKIFFEIAGTWISTGLLEDVSREFFVWETKGIKATYLEKLEENGSIGLNSNTGSRCVLVPELCPKVVRPYMMSIFQCGYNAQPSGKTLENWANIENPSRFIQKISTLTSELSASALKQMRNEGGFDEFLQCYFTIMLNSPYLTRIAITLIAKGLPDRIYKEIPDGALKSLTHLTILKDVGLVPLLNNFRFVKSNTNIFDALVNCQYVANNKESIRTRSETSQILADCLTLSVQLPAGLERMMSQDLIDIHSLIFRLQLRLTLAVAVLDQKKAEHSRKGVIETSFRQPLQLLNNMAHYLLRFRLMLFHAIQDAMKVLSENLSKAKRIEDVSIFQRECAAQIFKEAKLTEEYIYIIEDLISMIDSFAANYTFDQLFESYNMWLEQVETARFLVNDLGSFA